MPAGYPTTDTLHEHGWLPVPRAPLPFPSLVASSDNDPLCAAPRAAELANQWGSLLVELGAVGHLNPAAGYGPWPMAQTLIDTLL